MIIRNSLFLKITDGKPPFIGVEYEREAETYAGRHHIELLKSQNPMYTLYIESDKGFIRLVIRKDGYYDLIAYERLSCNLPDLHRWIELCAKAKSINFGHVVKYDFGHAIAKTAEGKPFFFPIRKIFCDLNGGPNEPIITVIDRFNK